MYVFLVLLLVLSIHFVEKHSFTNFAGECRAYIRYLHDYIFKMENIQSDLLSHQIKFNKIKKDIESKKDKKSGWF